VCLLAFVVLRFLGRRGFGGATANGLIRLVARLHLEPRRAVYVVEAAGRYFLIGTGESGAPATLAELDADAVQRLTATPRRPVSFLEVLRGRRDGPEEKDAGAGGAAR
jgi:flagellar biogenesis protein FliO